MSEEQTTQTPEILEPKDPPADPPAEKQAETFTLKVSGEEKKVTHEELIALAQKAEQAQRTATKLGEEKSSLSKDAGITAKLRAFKENPSDTTALQGYREALVDLGYTRDEIDTEMAELEVSLGTEEQQTQTPAPGDDRLAELERQNRELREVVSGRENAILTETISSILVEDEYIKETLKGVGDSERGARLELLAEKATSAAEQILQEKRNRDPRFVYDPSAAREIAGDAAKQAVDLAKRIGLKAPTPSGRDEANEAGLGKTIEPPKAPEGSTTPAQERKFLSSTIASLLQQERLREGGD